MTFLAPFDVREVDEVHLRDLDECQFCASVGDVRLKPRVANLGEDTRRIPLSVINWVITDKQHTSDRMSTLIDREFIEEYSRRYRNDMKSAEKHLFETVGPAVAKQGFYTKGQLLEVGRWKAERATGYLKNNLDQDVIDITRVALDHFKRITPEQRTSIAYVEYLSICGDIVRDVGGVTLRDLDRALWKWWDENKPSKSA